MRFLQNLLFCLTILSLASACSPQPGAGQGPAKSTASAAKLGSGQGEERVLAVVDGEAITVGDFNARMNRQSPYIRARYNSPAKKKEFLNNMIRFELQAREAERKGLDKHPDVVRTRKQVMIQKLTKQIFESQLKPQDIPDTEIEAYYKEHEGDYNKPEMIRASHILFKVDNWDDKKAVAAAKKQAKKILADLKKKKTRPDMFAEHARQYSGDARTKNRGGDLGYFARTEEGGIQEKAITEAAFLLKDINDLSSVVKGEKGFHIIRLTARRRPISKTLDQVKPTIRSTLYRKKRKELFNDFIEGLKAKAKVEIDEAFLADLPIEGAEAKKPGRGAPPVAPKAPGRPKLKVTPPAPKAAPAPAKKEKVAPAAPAKKAP